MKSIFLMKKTTKFIILAQFFDFFKVNKIGFKVANKTYKSLGALPRTPRLEITRKNSKFVLPGIESTGPAPQPPTVITTAHPNSSDVRWLHSKCDRHIS